MTGTGNTDDGDKDAQAGVTESAHRIWLAGLGAVAIAQEAGGKLFADLVVRGHQFAEQTQLKPPDMTVTLRKATDRAKQAVQHLGKEVDEQVASALHRLGVPGREEIAALSQRVEELTAIIEKMRPKEPPAE